VCLEVNIVIGRHAHTHIDKKKIVPAYSITGWHAGVYVQISQLQSGYSQEGYYYLMCLMICLMSLMLTSC